MKKIFLFLLLLINIFGIQSIYAEGGYEGAKSSYEQSKKTYDATKKAYDTKVAEYDKEINRLKSENDGPGREYYENEKKNYINQEKTKLEEQKQEMNDAYQNFKKEHAKKRENDCNPSKGGSGDCIDQPSFQFDTNNMFGIGPTQRKARSEDGANLLFSVIIQKLMVALGILSVLIMTVGGGYIVMYHGQDELLSKGKSIFNAGIIALVVALSSYMIVSLLRFILYNN